MESQSRRSSVGRELLGEEGADLGGIDIGRDEAWPMPRARMKVSWPRLTFLSCAMRSISASTPGQLPPGSL